MSIRARVRQLSFRCLWGYCLLCGDRGQATGEICADCEQALPVLTLPCYQCAYPLKTLDQTAEKPRCGQCITSPPAFDRTLVPWRYTSPIREMIVDFKFHSQLADGALLGGCFASWLRQYYQDQPLPEAILPVPLNTAREKARGFNQAKYLAQQLQTEFSLPLIDDLVIRHKPTAAQFSLPAKLRLANVRNAFSLRKTPNFSHLAIIDDIITSGSTVEAISRLLKDNGVKDISIWCLARAIK